MSIFNPAGGSAKNNGGAILANATLSNDLIDGVKTEGTSQLDTNTKSNPTVFTVTHTAAVPILNIDNINGYLAVDPSGGDMAEGVTFLWITSEQKLAGSYYVMDSSGDYFITSAQYSTCFDDLTAPFGEYSLESGVLGQDTGVPVMQAANHTLLCANGLDFTINEFNQYDSYVYTDCWQCFSGQLDPCDVSGSVVTLWRDDRLLQRVTYNMGGCVKSSNEDPGTQGDQA